MKELILEHIQLALENNEYPVSAALLIDGHVAAVSNNMNVSEGSRISHAELNVLRCINKSHSEKQVVLHTSLEPCLMCFGAICHSRISKLVYYCHDPSGGALDIDRLPPWYKENLPEVVYDDCIEQAILKSLIKYTGRTEGWGLESRLFREFFKKKYKSL